MKTLRMEGQPCDARPTHKLDLYFNFRRLDLVTDHLRPSATNIVTVLSEKRAMCFISACSGSFLVAAIMVLSADARPNCGLLQPTSQPHYERSAGDGCEGARRGIALTVGHT